LSFLRPVAGALLRDVPNGLTIPPSLSLRTLAEGALHPAWWFDLLTTEKLEFALLNCFEGTVADAVGKMFDPAAIMGDLALLRWVWDGPLIVKGMQTVVDARAKVYVDGGILSGSVVVAAVAFGARVALVALVGLAYLYGLMAGGERGVQQAAEILGEEVAGTLALRGVTRTADLRREHSRLRGT
jgi:L-lactate dehydrogenase (cytochrome)